MSSVSPVSWWYEVEAAVNAVIFNLTTDHPRLLVQILLILTVNKVDDWLPASERERGGGGGRGEGGREREGGREGEEKKMVMMREKREERGTR